MKIEPPLPDHPFFEPIFTFNACVVDKASGQSANGILSGLSLDGCLFQSPSFFSPGSILRLQFFLNSHCVEVSAVVRDVTPARSLRLEFFALDSADSLQALQQWLTSQSTSLERKT